MRLATAITAAPRPGNVNYLDATIASLLDAGFNDIEIVGDSELSGSYVNLLRTLKGMLKDGAEALAVFQDDVEVAKGLRSWLDKNLWPGPVESVGVVSLYTCQVNLQSQDGWFRLRDLPAHRPFGACAFVFPRHAAEKLIANPPNQGFRCGSDTSVATFCIREKLDWWMHSPGLCEHRGEETTMGHTLGLNEHRRAGVWIQDCAMLTEAG